MLKLQLPCTLLYAAMSVFTGVQDSLRIAAESAVSDTLKARLYNELSRNWARSNFDSSFHYAALALLPKSHHRLPAYRRLGAGRCDV